MEPVSLGLGIAGILSNLFGNLFGAGKQASSAKSAAEIQSKTAERIAAAEREAQDRQLAYLQGVDARDYRDWLNREARDRTDWENQERRKAPYRALGDSAIRTLADYIRVPGMQPAQEVPVQQWTDPAPRPVSTTMPVGGTLSAYTQQPVSQARPLFQTTPMTTRRTLADFAP